MVLAAQILEPAILFALIGALLRGCSLSLRRRNQHLLWLLGGFGLLLAGSVIRLLWSVEELGLPSALDAWDSAARQACLPYTSVPSP